MTKSQEKWQQKQKAVKAIQIAFELEQNIATKIRTQAAQQGLTPSDQIRKLLNLPYSKPKRPRLTVSLSNEDYLVLGKKFNIDPKDHLAIRKQIMAFLVTHV